MPVPQKRKLPNAEIKLLESAVLPNPNKERVRFTAEFLLCNSNANPAMKLVLGIPVRFLSSDLETSCALTESKDLLPAIAIIQSAELCRGEKFEKSSLF